MGFLNICAAWAARLFGSRTAVQVGRVNLNAKTGDGSPLVQLPVSGGVHAAGDVVYNVGTPLTEKQLEELAERIVQKQITVESRRVAELENENQELKKQVALAIRSVEAAEKKGLPDAAGLMQELLRRGESARLLAFVLARRQLLEKVGALTPDQSLYLNRQIAAVAYVAGEIETAKSAVDEALKAKTDDPSALSLLGSICILRGELGQAEEAYRSVLKRAVADSNESTIADAYESLGNIYYTRGEFDLAEAAHRKGLEMYSRLGDKKGIARGYCGLGNVCFRRGHLDKAEEMHVKALEIFQSLGHHEGVSVALGNLGGIYCERENLGKAEEMFLKSLEISEKSSEQVGIGKSCLNLGNVYRKRGELKRAEDMYRRSLQVNMNLGRQEGMAMAHFGLGGVENLRRNIPIALQHWTIARDIFRKIGMSHLEKTVQMLLDWPSTGNGTRDSKTIRPK